jgi:hypothetical protein
VNAIVVHAWEELQNTVIAIQGIFVHFGDYWESPQNVAQENGAQGAPGISDGREMGGTVDPVTPELLPL